LFCCYYNHSGRLVYWYLVVGRQPGRQREAML